MASYSSSDTWVVTDHCDSPECHGSPAYPLKTYRSPSFVTVNNNQTMFNISFADTTSACHFVVHQIWKLMMFIRCLGLYCSRIFQVRRPFSRWTRSWYASNTSEPSSDSNTLLGMVTTSNLTLGQSVSGILGLGFPRLSRITTSIPGGEHTAPLSISAHWPTSLTQPYPFWALLVNQDSLNTLSSASV